jgi:hypothetical protein
MMDDGGMMGGMPTGMPSASGEAGGMSSEASHINRIIALGWDQISLISLFSAILWV